MTGPVYLLGGFDYGVSLVVALVVGFFFGFVLERAGFGDARNLTNIFYFRDMRVLRVMFSALVTAMLGLVILSAVGLFDYETFVEAAVVTTYTTYLWPQLVGGVLFGLGFLIGGYCPGTAVVGVMSGKYDAIAFLGGMVGGIWIFAAGFPSWGSFYKSSNLGGLTLPELFNLPLWLTAALVTAMALAAFYLAGLGEKWAPYDK